jgi:hypothetical protein
MAQAVVLILPKHPIPILIGAQLDGTHKDIKVPIGIYYTQKHPTICTLSQGAPQAGLS